MLPVHTILYPTDFSESAQSAFPLAWSLARDCGARVVVLHVVPSPVGHDELVVRYQPEEYYLPARQALQQIEAPDHNVRVEHRLEEGEAAERICKVAEEIQAGLIVIGTHGRSGISRLLMGSVAEKVLRRACCPVLTVKSPLPAAKDTAHKPKLVK